jgi:hypothetical protein
MNIKPPPAAKTTRIMSHIHHFRPRSLPEGGLVVGGLVVGGLVVGELVELLMPG